MSSIAEKIVKQKLTPEEQKEQNLARFKELNDAEKLPEAELQKKIDSLAQTPGRETDANLLSMQAGLNKAVPAVAGITSKVISGADRAAKILGIKQNAEILRKAVGLGKQGDDVVNLMNRAQQGGLSEAEKKYLQEKLKSLGPAGVKNVAKP